MSAFASSKHFPTWAIIVATFGGVIVLSILAAIIYSILRPKEANVGQNSFSEQGREHFVGSLTLEVVRNATDNFSNERVLGTGGYGIVYRGKGPNGDDWAVKRAKEAMVQGKVEFQEMVSAFSRLAHVNILSLKAYCHENGEQILIYDYMSNGTLRAALQNKENRRPLTFEQRLNIAIGAAEGLRYLHHYARPQIIHRNVKSENILLDEDLQARVADFGLLNDEAAEDGEHTINKVAGTLGYIDPEYNKVTPKSDVYGFGIVLLEIFSGRGPLVRGNVSDPGEPTTISHTSYNEHFVRGIVSKIADPDLNGSYPSHAMKELLGLATQCLAKLDTHRPSMEHVAQRLSHIKTSCLTENEIQECSEEGDTFQDVPEETSKSFVVMELDYSSLHSISGSGNGGSNFQVPVSGWSVR